MYGCKTSLDVSIQLLVGKGGGTISIEYNVKPSRISTRPRNVGVLAIWSTMCFTLFTKQKNSRPGRSLREYRTNVSRNALDGSLQLSGRERVDTRCPG